jgi:hypothetical protein
VMLARESSPRLSNAREFAQARAPITWRESKAYHERSAMGVAACAPDAVGEPRNPVGQSA